MKNSIKDFVISSDANVRDVIKRIDTLGVGFCLVSNSLNKIIGIVTDGDFRRSILKNVSLDANVSLIMNSDFINLNFEYTKVQSDLIFSNSKITNIPVLKDGELVEILYREEAIKYEKEVEEKLNLPVVIMAGGKGTRMQPFTNILPKPLIPIGEKSILDLIMDEYNKYTESKFFLSLNHKGEMIKSYLTDSRENDDISYIYEKKPLGTAGALSQLKDMVDSTFFVSNCDIIIKENYIDIYDFHRNGKFDITIVGAMMHYKIPYGVCNIIDGGELTSMTEKPEYDFLINSGMYLLNKEVLNFIPENEFFHITHLIDKVRAKGLKVGVYPVSENSYIDIGQWDEYRSALKKLEIY